MWIILSRPVKFTGDGPYVPVGTRVEVDGVEGKRLCQKGAAVPLTESSSSVAALPAVEVVAPQPIPDVKTAPTPSAKPELVKPKTLVKPPARRR